MTQDLQEARDGAGMAGEGDEVSGIVRTHVVQKFFEAGVPRRVRLAQVRVPERIGLGEAGLDVIFWIFGGDGGLAGAAVTGVYPESFTDELDFASGSV